MAMGSQVWFACGFLYSRYETPMRCSFHHMREKHRISTSEDAIFRGCDNMRTSFSDLHAMLCRWDKRQMSSRKLEDGIPKPIYTHVRQLFLRTSHLTSASPPSGLLAACPVVGGTAGAGAGCTGSGNISLNIPGKNRSSRFHVSSHNRILSGFSWGGTKYPPFAITRRMFFKLSGTASSYSSVSLSHAI